MLKCNIQIFLSTLLLHFTVMVLLKMSRFTSIAIFTVYFLQVATNEQDNKITTPTPCTCGVFLTGQFKKGSKEQPKGLAALTQELEGIYPNNLIGIRQCTNKCLESIIKHLPNSADIICATIDRDCYKERAYLFIQNHNSTWINSNMSAGREFCCKDNLSYKCPAS